MERARTIRLAGMAAAAAVVVATFWVLGRREAGPPLGFPLDDAWIHVRFAQNLSGTGRFAFNPGQPTAGSTAPLWVVALAAVSLFSNEFVVSAILLSVFSYVVLVVWTRVVAGRAFYHGAAALLVALIVLVNVRVVWAALSGMETCLAAFLALAAAGSFAADESERAARLPAGDSAASPTSPSPNAPGGSPVSARLRPWMTPVLFGLASLARPEAHLLFLLAVVLKIARSCRRDTPVSALVRLIPYRMIAVYLLVTLPWHLLCLWWSGSLLPNTFRANFRGLATRVYPVGFYWRYARWLFLRDHPWVYWLVPLGVLATLWWSFRRSEPRSTNIPLRPYGLALVQLSALWVCVYPPAARMVLPMLRHHARYMIPMTPFHALLAVLGLSVMVTALASLWRRRTEAIRRRATAVLWAIVSVAVVVSAIPGLLHWSRLYGRNVYTINHQHVAMARWLREHTPADAIVATHDIGALGAVSGRQLMDLFGLVTPDMIHQTTSVIPTYHPTPDRLWWFLEQLEVHGASYLVGYPGWLSFMILAPDCFEEIHRETVEEVDISGGLTLVAYRIDRDRLRRILAGR